MATEDSSGTAAQTSVGTTNAGTHKAFIVALLLRAILAGLIHLESLQGLRADVPSVVSGQLWTATSAVPHGLSFYRDGGDWTSGKIAMRSPRTEPRHRPLAT